MVIKSTSWDYVWMNIAETIAEMKSKDPEIKVGSVLVSDDNKQMSVGFNGFAKNIKETEERWSNDSKKDLVIHAEENALHNANTDVSGWTIYITLFPCTRCANIIINNGIKRVVYLNDYKKESSWNQKRELTLELLKEAGVKIEKLSELEDSVKKSIVSTSKKSQNLFMRILMNLLTFGNRP